MRVILPSLPSSVLLLLIAIWLLLVTYSPDLLLPFPLSSRLQIQPPLVLAVINVGLG